MLTFAVFQGVGAKVRQRRQNLRRCSPPGGVSQAAADSAADGAAAASAAAAAANAAADLHAVKPEEDSEPGGGAAGLEGALVQCTESAAAVQIRKLGVPSLFLLELSGLETPLQ